MWCCVTKQIHECESMRVCSRAVIPCVAMNLHPPPNQPWCWIDRPVGKNPILFSAPSDSKDRINSRSPPLFFFLPMPHKRTHVHAQYYTDYVYAPVRSIAEASTTGHGTNIITGVAVGMKSTVIPCVTVSVAVIAAYHLGKTSGVGDGHSAGIFGTAVATMGMLSSAVYILSMNNFGEIREEKGRWENCFWCCILLPDSFVFVF